MIQLSQASAELFGAVGLPLEDVRRWLTSQSRDPSASDAFRPADYPKTALTVSPFLLQGNDFIRRLPPRRQRTEREEHAASRLHEIVRETRNRFERAYAAEIYAALTDDLRVFRRADDLVYRAAEQFPGLTPTRAEIAAEAELPLKGKEGWEIDQGLFLSWILAQPRAGAHLVQAMLQPKPESLARLAEFQRTDRLALPTAVVERRGAAGYVHLRNTPFLNAEDDGTNADLETAIDLVLLDGRIEVGVLRGAPVDHPKYRGRGVFNAGLNLTHLYQGKISYLFYLTRDLGLVNKLYRGLANADFWPEGPETTLEKPWIAAVEAFAIGGGCQLLLTLDHIIAEQGAFFSLPARKEGIIPGCANLRLARWVGTRLARQAILFDRRFPVDTPEGRLLCDEVVPGNELNEAVDRAVASLTQSGLVSAAGNRKVLRVAQEPLSQFQAYLSLYAREQAYCHFSPTLVRNLEENWRAKER